VNLELASCNESKWDVSATVMVDRMSTDFETQMRYGKFTSRRIKAAVTSICTCISINFINDARHHWSSPAALSKSSGCGKVHPPDNVVLAVLERMVSWPEHNLAALRCVIRRPGDHVEILRGLGLRDMYLYNGSLSPTDFILWGEIGSLKSRCKNENRNVLKKQGDVD